MNRINRDPLTNEEIQKAAPSAFAGQPYHEQSHRYAFVPTVAIIDGMREAGFMPVQASQSSSRIADKRNFTKHMIRFRSINTHLSNVGDSTLETVMVNSHDGTSSYQFFGGIFRLVCSNGMVVSEGLIGSIRINHVGDIASKAVAASIDMLKDAPKVMETIAAWRSIMLTRPEQMLLAEAAHTLRFEEGSNMAEAITPESLLKVNRLGDNADDLWTVHNRIQENTVRGGLRARRSDGTRVRSRAVTGIDQNVKLNQALWTLSEKMAAFKS